MTITPLNASDTFKTWFNTTNSVISEVNGITIHNLVAGDGLNVTSAGGNVFTVSHGSLVAGGVTFTGNVNFTGSVSLSTVPDISTLSVKVTPKTSGLTAGNVVRAFSGGLTLAKADTAENAEVLGIVIGEDASNNIVAVAGGINNSLFSSTIPNALGVVGATLIPNQAYFLSPTVAGGITTIEPNIYGLVSKPVLLGITGNSGSYLSYRGILIEGISAGISAELDNKAIVQIDYSSIDPTKTGGVKPGDIVCYMEDSSASSSTIDGYAGKVKTAGKLNNSTYNNAFIPDLNTTFSDFKPLVGPQFLGLVSKILSNTSNVYLLEITLPGGSFNVTISDLDSNFYITSLTNKTNPLRINNSCDLEDATNDNSKFIDFIKTDANTGKIIVHSQGLNETGTAPRSTPAPSSSSSVVSGMVEYDNLIPNGAFSIWQRGVTLQTETSLTGGSRHHFADRWFIHTPRPEVQGLTATVTRAEFDSNQTDVYGSPLYYATTKFLYGLSGSNLYHRPKLENIQRDVRLLQGQTVTASFWAKATSSGVSLDVFYNFYNETNIGATFSYERTLAVSGITLNTAWTEYVNTFSIGYAGFTLAPTERGWFGFGFEFPSSSETVSITNVQMDIGDSVSPAIFVPREAELERCKPYYLRSYNLDTETGTIFAETPAEIQIGNMSTKTNYSVLLPTTMAGSPHTINIYDWSTGAVDDVYITNIGTRATGAASKYQGLPWQTSSIFRTPAPAGNPNFARSATKNKLTLSTLSGAFASLDTVWFHYTLDSDIQEE